jgi:hypothetical protein
MPLTIDEAQGSLIDLSMRLTRLETDRKHDVADIAEVKAGVAKIIESLEKVNLTLAATAGRNNATTTISNWVLTFIALAAGLFAALKELKIS